MDAPGASRHLGNAALCSRVALATILADNLHLAFRPGYLLMKVLLIAALCLVNVLGCAIAADQYSTEATREVVEITATREPESVQKVPASITIITGEELRLRGAHDLRTALSLVSGVEGTPGGDSGPAGTVPALW